jgi:hypothetical protein
MATGFSIQYTDKTTGERKTEKPRLMITLDGKNKSLFLGDGPIATVPIDQPDSALWQLARAWVTAHPTNQ